MTIEALKALKEAELRERILIPLFGLMGYQDVRLWHGGILEQGKDIVMWEKTNLGTRLNYAAVVLAERINGQATGATSAAKVVMQVHQAIGKPFRDAVTGQECPVDRLLVVTSHEITKEAKESIASALAPSPLNRMVNYLDGETLIKEINRLMPTEGAVLQLEEIAKTIQPADADIAIGVALTGGKKRFWFEDKTDGPPRHLTISLRNDESPEAHALQKSFEAHERLGTPVRIPASLIKDVNGPEFIKTFLTQLGSFVLPGKSNGSSLDVRLHVQQEDGAVFTTDPFNITAKVRSPTLIYWDNAHEKSPFCIKISLKDSTVVAINFTFDHSDLNAFEENNLLKLQDALTRGTNLWLVDVKTGLRIDFGIVTRKPSKSTINNEWKALIGKLAAIQMKTGAIIPVASIGTDDTSQDTVENLHTAVTTAHLIVSGFEPCVNLDRQNASELLRFAQEKKKRFVLTQGIVSETVKVFGTEVILGPSVVCFEDVKLSNESLLLLERTVHETGCSDPLLLRFQKADGKRVLVRFLPPDTEIPAAIQAFLAEFGDRLANMNVTSCPWRLEAIDI